MRILVLASVLLAPVAAQAQAISGAAATIDGDTLDVSGVRVRLFGIDAPEFQQTCERGGETWRCGEEAAALLRDLAGRGPLRCEQRDVDAYGRSVASCSVGRIDLAEAMARAGLAVPLERYGEDYVGAAHTARTYNLGMWAGNFEQPQAFRERHREADQLLADAPQPVRANAAPRRQAVREVFYANCSHARSAGAAPLYRGNPGYRPQMDADNDGVACEPYRGR